MLIFVIFSAVSSLGTAPPARFFGQAVCRLVTPTAPRTASIPFVHNTPAFRRSRWCPVVLRREALPISFPSISLPNTFLHNEGGTPLPNARPPMPPRTNPGRPLHPVELGAKIGVRPETSPRVPVSKLGRAEIGLTASLPAASRSHSRLQVVTKAIRPGDPKGCRIARAGKASRVRLG